VAGWRLPVGHSVTLLLFVCVFSLLLNLFFFMRDARESHTTYMCCVWRSGHTSDEVTARGAAASATEHRYREGD